MPKTMPRMIALRVNSGGDSPGGTYGRNSGTLAIWTSLRRGGHQVGGDYMQAVFTSLRAAGIFTLSFRGAKRRGIPGFSTEGSLASLEMTGASSSFQGAAYFSLSFRGAKRRGIPRFSRKDFFVNDTATT